MFYKYLEIWSLRERFWLDGYVWILFLEVVIKILWKNDIVKEECIERGERDKDIVVLFVLFWEVKLN